MTTIHRRTHYFVCQMVKYQHELEQKYSDWFDEQKCVIYASKISEEYKNSEPWCSTEIIRTRLYLRNYFLLLPESQQFSRWRRRGSRQQQLVGIDFPQRCNQYKMLYTISLFPINNTVYETTQFVDWLNLTAHRHVVHRCQFAQLYSCCETGFVWSHLFMLWWSLCRRRPVAVESRPV